MKEAEVNRLFKKLEEAIQLQIGAAKNLSRPLDKYNAAQWRTWHESILESLLRIIDETKIEATKNRFPPVSVVFNLFARFKNQFRSPTDMIDSIRADINSKKFEVLKSVILYLKEEKGETSQVIDYAKLTDEEIIRFLEWGIERMKSGQSATE